MARITLQTPESMPELFEFLSERRGPFGAFNIFRAMANCPDILRAFISLADVIRQGYGIDPVLRELAVIQTCQVLGSSYEHDRHWNIAVSLGAPKSKLENIWQFERCDNFTPLEKAVLRLAREATRAPEQVSAEIWDDVRTRLGEQQALALLFSVGWYNLTARISGPLDLEDEPGFARA